MADIYLHSRLSEEVTKKLNFEFNMPLVYIGAQGPDPMYYNITKEAKEYRYYADRMHDTDTSKLFVNMIQYVKSNLTQDTYSFLVGFICHYALDVNIHPYVYHNVGVYKKEDPKTHSYRGLHLKFERSIDAVMIEKEQQIPSKKMRLHKTYFPKVDLPDEVAKVIGHTVKETYLCETGTKMYKEAVKMMYNNIKNLVTDRFGVKKQLLKLLDLTNKADMFLPDLSFYNHVEEGYDFLNLNKKTWYHPITNEPFTYSIPEIFDNAVVFAVSLIKEVDKFLKGEAVILEEVFTNLSFNSGLDCNHPDEMKYFNIYRK